MAPHVQFKPPDITERVRRELLQVLEGVRGKKNLVIERALAGPIGLFVKFSTLQEYGVDKVFFLENDNIDSSQRNVVFLARAEKAKVILAVSDQIKRVRRTSQIDHEFSVIWVPRRTLVSNQVLEEAGVLGEASVSELPLYFVPLEDDLLSLELDESFSDLYLRKDPTSIFTSAKALMLLQQRHGLFPRIFGKGDNAKRLADLLMRMRSEVNAGEESNSNTLSFLGLTPSATFENLIIIDREVDFSTVLLTQLTYEGLIDEFFSVKNNSTEVATSIVGAPPPPPGSQQSASTGSPAPAPVTSQKRKIQLDSSDKLYEQLRSENFAIVGSLLSKIARRLQASYDNKSIASKNVSELRDFVKNLPGYQAEQASLKIHTDLAAEIMKQTKTDFFMRALEVQQNIAAGTDPRSQHDTIEELINRDAPLTLVLRLLCLESCIAGGLTPKDYEYFKRLILHGYGFQHLLTFSLLEKMGLLQSRAAGAAALFIPANIREIGSASAGTKTNYSSLRRQLRLIVDEVNEQDPNDISYVYSGYAPLSVRVVQTILQKQTLQNIISPPSKPTKDADSVPSSSLSGLSAAQGFRPFDDAVRQIRGATFIETQSGEEKAVRARQVLSSSASQEEKIHVVFFLGGICQAEVAALRFVKERLKTEGRGKLVIMTTGLINGDAVVKAAIEGMGVLDVGKGAANGGGVGA